MRWSLSWCADPRAAALADRHYSRQTIGARQFMPSGRKLVLLTEAADAVWGTLWSESAYVDHAWKHAWSNTLFRNESGHLSSELIREAVAATRWYFGEPPAEGFVTFIAVNKVRHKRDPGRCYRKAGWRPVGWTKSGHLVLQLRPDEMPPPAMPIGAQFGLAVPA